MSVDKTDINRKNRHHDPDSWINKLTLTKNGISSSVYVHSILVPLHLSRDSLNRIVFWVRVLGYAVHNKKTNSIKQQIWQTTHPLLVDETICTQQSTKTKYPHLICLSILNKYALKQKATKKWKRVLLCWRTKPLVANGSVPCITSIVIPEGQKGLEHLRSKFWNESNGRSRGESKPWWHLIACSC